MVLFLCGNHFACDGTPTWVLDASPLPDSSISPQDATIYPDGTPSLFADLTLAGCAELIVTPETYQCVGRVPLDLQFGALVPPDAATVIWDFGDGTPPSTALAPSHRYDLPGTFRLTLVVGGPFGTISPSRLVQVMVTPAPLGAYCAKDAQCGSQSCLCGAGSSGCPGVLEGTCTASCDACAAPDVCADLRVPDATALPEWRDLLCLPGCSSVLDCLRGGFGCREVPSPDGQGAQGWARACLPEVLGDVGAGCVGTGGNLVPTGCLSSDCVDLGRFGLCTASCALSSCPSYASCVVFYGGPRAGEPLCLAACSPARPCTSDPALACVAPNPAGELGFTLLGSGVPAGTTFCAPRRCAGPLDCPSGVCDLAQGGFCQ